MSSKFNSIAFFELAVPNVNYYQADVDNGVDGRRLIEKVLDCHVSHLRGERDYQYLKSEKFKSIKENRPRNTYF